MVNKVRIFSGVSPLQRSREVRYDPTALYAELAAGTDPETVGNSKVTGAYFDGRIPVALNKGSNLSTIVQIFENTSAWIAPKGVTKILIEAWGAGGGGGYNAGNGGGGAAYVNTIAEVIPGVSYSVLVGMGGIGGSLSNANGFNGGNSSIITAPFIILISANGGRGGAGNGAGLGTGGTTTASDGMVKFGGGNGAAPNGSNGGGGGSSGTVNGTGNNATDINGAIAPIGVGGNGGNGGLSGVQGQGGTLPGGGGGGGGLGFGGANGSNGKVIISYMM